MANFFVFLAVTGFSHVEQAVLELLASSDPPASASQNAAGVSYLAQLHLEFFFNQLAAVFFLMSVLFRRFTFKVNIDTWDFYPIIRLSAYCFVVSVVWVYCSLCGRFT